MAAGEFYTIIRQRTLSISGVHRKLCNSRVARLSRGTRAVLVLGGVLDRSEGRLDLTAGLCKTPRAIDDVIGAAAFLLDRHLGGDATFGFLAREALGHHPLD